MLNKDELFERYNISSSDFDKTDLDWKILESIYEDYKTKRDSLSPTAKSIAELLQAVSSVHSLKIRLKDPEHLVEKIIRKTIEKCKEIERDEAANKVEQYSIENYLDKITDRIGIRALHLFKEDWQSIHKFIISQWDLKETPTANVRKGDSSENIDIFKNAGCNIKEHLYGYRSVHYLVKSSLTKETHIAEIQVRTIFEEGWSEIDHHIRYPYDTKNPILGQYLAIFNRLAGSADEMGSFVKHLKIELDKKTKLIENEIQEKNRISDELKKKIGELEINREEKEAFENQVNDLTQSNSNLLTGIVTAEFNLFENLIALPKSKLFDTIAESNSDAISNLFSKTESNFDTISNLFPKTTESNLFPKTTESNLFPKTTDNPETDEDD